MTSAEVLPLIRVYDLREPAARQASHRHRGFWGKLYTDIHALDPDHVALVFRPAPDERWRAWERVRLRGILEERGRVNRRRRRLSQHDLRGRGKRCAAD